MRDNPRFSSALIDDDIISVYNLTKFLKAVPGGFIENQVNSVLEAVLEFMIHVSGAGRFLKEILPLRPVIFNSMFSLTDNIHWEQTEKSLRAYLHTVLNSIDNWIYPEYSRSAMSETGL